MLDYPTGEQIAALAEPGAYPLDPSARTGVEWVQTHISHLFFTGERVYKLRKPVDLGFLCFTSREERNADCLREVELNRRLAPDVYLGVAPLELDVGHAQIGKPGDGLMARAPVPEHCVVMRRLPQGRDALSLLQRGELRPERLDRLASLVAAFHRDHSLGQPARFGAAEWRERCTAPALDNFRLLAGVPEDVVPRSQVARVGARVREFAAANAGRFESRRMAGCAVDGHGDLHLQHVWFERDDAIPLVIDCLEFSEELRRIDQAAEVAFPAMDLAYRGHEELAERFLEVYARERDDHDLYGVVDYFASYRAAVRAKVAAVAAGDEAIDAVQRVRAAESARRHLDLAERLLEPRRPGALVLVGGVVGTGKSTVAEELARALPGVAIASDRVRKQRAGLVPSERPAAPEAVYSAEAKDRVYDALLELGRTVASSGRNVVLDATWGRRAWRERARRVAFELGVHSFFVETQCAPEVALERLARRAAAHDDASDAGPELHAASVAGFEGFDPIGEGARHLVRTDAPDWRARCFEVAAALRGRDSSGRI